MHSALEVEADGRVVPAATDLSGALARRAPVASAEARECPVGGCPKPGRGLKPETSARRMWSDASRWPGGQLPKAWGRQGAGAGDWDTRSSGRRRVFVADSAAPAKDLQHHP